MHQGAVDVHSEVIVSRGVDRGLGWLYWRAVLEERVRVCYAEGTLLCKIDGGRRLICPYPRGFSEKRAVYEARVVGEDGARRGLGECMGECRHSSLLFEAGVIVVKSPWMGVIYEEGGERRI